MKRVGTVLIILGSVSMLMAITPVSEDYSSYNEEYYSSGDKFAIASVFLLSGGIPLWIVGAHSEVSTIKN